MQTGYPKQLLAQAILVAKAPQVLQEAQAPQASQEALVLDLLEVQVHKALQVM